MSMFWPLSRISTGFGKERKNAQRFSAPLHSGFSILEVLITAAIIGIITGIITLRYGSFNNLILLKNQAYQIAIDLREMQTRALSVAGSVADFRRPYGVYFNADDTDRYVTFIEMDNRGESGYGFYGEDEELETRRLDQRFRLKRICSGSDIDDCTPINSLSIIFQRPNFDAVMNNGAVTNALIEVETVTGDGTRVININAAGQITVN